MRGWESARRRPERPRRRWATPACSGRQRCCRWRAQASRSGAARGYDPFVPDRLHFTESDDANALIAQDPMALLIGFALDQQVTVQKAFAGPLVLKERLGTLDAAALTETDLESIFAEKPAIHRFPG